MFVAFFLTTVVCLNTFILCYWFVWGGKRTIPFTFPTFHCFSLYPLLTDWLIFYPLSFRHVNLYYRWQKQQDRWYWKILPCTPLVPFIYKGVTVRINFACPYWPAEYFLTTVVSLCHVIYNYLFPPPLLSAFPNCIIIKEKYCQRISYLSPLNANTTTMTASVGCFWKDMKYRRHVTMRSISTFLIPKQISMYRFVINAPWIISSF